MDQKSDFHSLLKKKADRYAHEVYRAAKEFPKEEIYGLTSQFRRAALSVILNYTEGYARLGDKQYANFLRISYGSLKEAQYLLEFAYKENYLNDKTFNTLNALGSEVGAMLWTTIRGLKEK